MSSEQLAQLERKLQFLTLATVGEGDNSRKRDIAGQIARYHQQIANLRKHLNAQLPISRFPPEVLTGIFAQFISLLRKKEKDELGVHGSGRPYRWILITHVCHNWRRVALSVPKLWSRIIVIRAECVRELVARSKSAPLSLKADLINHTSAQSLTREVLTNLQRIVSIDLQVSREQVLVELCHNAPPAPSLRCLVVNISDHEVSSNSSAIPFLTSQDTRLQHFSYTSPIFYWNPVFARPGLKSLTLVNTTQVTFREALRAPSIIGMLTALQSMATLEELRLEGVFPPNAGLEEAQSNTSIRLAHLRFLHLVDTATACSSLLKCLCISPNTCLDLDCTLSNPHDFRHVVEAIITSQVSSSHRSTPDTYFTIRSLSAASSSRENLRLRTWPVVHALSSFINPTTTPSLDLVVRGKPDLIHPAMQVACSYLPLSGLITANVERDWISPEDHALWRDGTKNMPELRGLRISGGIGNCLPEVLALVGRADVPPALPRLRTLMLENIDVKVSVEGWGGRFLDRLKSSLLERKRQGAGLKKLLLKVCINLVAGEEHDLQVAVDELKWDRTEFLTTERSRGSRGMRWIEVKEDVKDMLEDYLDD